MATIRHRRRLGRELAALRKARGLSQVEVAQRLGWSQPTVGRIEAAKTKDVADPVRELLDLYEVPEPARERLLQMATSSTGAGWWTVFSGAFMDTSYIALEDEASRIRSWQSDLIPGLLQDEEYARALLAASIGAEAESPELVQQRLRARMLRRSMLDRACPPHLHVVLDEAVLHRQIGGPEAMRRQLRYLEHVARRPNIDMQIMTFDAGAHPGVDGRFVILSFDDGDPDVPYIESQGGAVYLEAPSEINRMNLAWDSVTRAALSLDRSRELLTRLAKET
jgi:transcriptional regulator with XRE-family HTH domain